MRKACFFLLLTGTLTQYHHAMGQVVPGRKLDSLKEIAFVARPDTNSLSAFAELQRFYFNLGRYDSALYYCLASVKAAQKVTNPSKTARLYYNTGLVYTNLTRYDSAKIYLDKAEQTAVSTKDTALLINTYNAIAILCNYQSDFKTAITYMTKVAGIIEESGNDKWTVFLPQTYGNIGHNLIAENQLEKGIAYEKKALLIKNYPDEQRYRTMLHLDITDASIKLKNIPQATMHLDSARQLERVVNNIQVTSLMKNTEGYYYAETNNLPQSINAYLRAFSIADSVNNEYLKAEAADNVARIYLRMKSPEQAQKFASLAKEIAIRLQNFKVAASSYETLKSLAATKGDYKAALLFSEMHKLYADSATNTETQKSAVYLDALYQNQVKENAIARLKVSNADKELAVVKRNRMLLIGGTVASALLLLMGLLNRYGRAKRLVAEKDVMLKQEHVKFLERQQQVVSLKAMVNGQETERSRIAKDLHDGLGGLFSTIKMYFSTLQHDQPKLKEEAIFVKSYELVHSASEEVRRIAHNMMPEVLIKIGLLQAVQELCNSVSAGKLLRATLQSYGMEKRLNASTEIMLFRIIQELLNNIIKHAKATEAIIQFNKEGNRLSIIVEDNGQGFNLAETGDGAKAGLASVESRVTYLNGKFSIDSQKETGTTVMMDFLLNESAGDAKHK